MREGEIAGGVESVFLGIKDLLSGERAEAKSERTQVIISKGRLEVFLSLSFECWVGHRASIKTIHRE